MYETNDHTLMELAVIKMEATVSKCIYIKEQIKCRVIII